MLSYRSGFRSENRTGNRFQLQCHRIISIEGDMAHDILLPLSGCITQAIAVLEITGLSTRCTQLNRGIISVVNFSHHLVYFDVGTRYIEYYALIGQLIDLPAGPAHPVQDSGAIHIDGNTIRERTGIQSKIVVWLGNRFKSSRLAP